MRFFAENWKRICRDFKQKKLGSNYEFIDSFNDTKYTPIYFIDCWSGKGINIVKNFGFEGNIEDFYSVSDKFDRMELF